MRFRIQTNITRRMSYLSWHRLGNKIVRIPSRILYLFQFCMIRIQVDFTLITLL